jgi:hypothetical protein
MDTNYEYVPQPKLVNILRCCSRIRWNQSRFEVGIGQTCANSTVIQRRVPVPSSTDGVSRCQRDVAEVSGTGGLSAYMATHLSTLPLASFP